MNVINNTINPDISTQPPSKPNLFKYLFFLSLFVFLAVTVTSYFILNNKISKLSSLQQNNDQIISTPTNIPTQVAKQELVVSKNDDPISYSTTGVAVSVSKETVPFDYTVDQLKALAEECGTKHEENYFKKLVAKFSNSNKTIYHFKYQGVSQEPSDYIVTLLPNAADYSSLEQFKKDFDMCYAGGSAYPQMLNENWLLFTRSCGSGAGDSSGRPYGCEEVRAIVEPSLKFTK